MLSLSWRDLPAEVQERAQWRGPRWRLAGGDKGSPAIAPEGGDWQLGEAAMSVPEGRPCRPRQAAVREGASTIAPGVDGNAREAMTTGEAAAPSSYMRGGLGGAGCGGTGAAGYWHRPPLLLGSVEKIPVDTHK